MLVKELRLKNISDIAEANQYLDEFMLDYNKRFAKRPISNQDKHRPIPDHMKLDNIFSFKTMRTVSHNLTFQHDRQLYILKNTLEARQLRRKHVFYYLSTQKVA